METSGPWTLLLPWTVCGHSVLGRPFLLAGMAEAGDIVWTDGKQTECRLVAINLMSDWFLI